MPSGKQYLENDGRKDLQDPLPDAARRNQKSAERGQVTMKLKIIIALVAMISIASIAFADRLPSSATQSGTFPTVGGVQVQGYSPTGVKVKSIGTGGKSVFKNFSTAGMVGVKCTGRTSTGVATTVKVRPGGFVTGAETDVYPTSEELFQVPPGKIGFQAYSTANVINVHCGKR